MNEYIVMKGFQYQGPSTNDEICDMSYGVKKSIFAVTSFMDDPLEQGYLRVFSLKCGIK